jgi:hypothetical protein
MEKSMDSSAENIFDADLKKFKPPFEPRYVLLFSGHMIDAPDRKSPRFPAGKEPAAARAISSKLDELGAGPADIGLCGGACGGDLLFAEACLARGIHMQIRIPFDEPTFLKKSVTFAGGNWLDRYYAVKISKLTAFFVMPEELGPTPENVDPYERNNRWLLHTALSMGAEKVKFICLWDGKKVKKRGGTQHMYEEVEKQSGHAYIIDTNKL